MKKRFATLMLALVMLLAACSVNANETESAKTKADQGYAAVHAENGNEEMLSGAFDDVPEDSFYAKAVSWAVKEGITNGLTATTFGPDAQCNRAQVVTFLWRLAGQPAASGENIFTDVPESEWYADAVLWAVDQKITDGVGGGLFLPTGTCNRAQIVTFLWRYAGKSAADVENPFNDVPDDEWYADAVLWAVEKGITNGLTDNTFGPDQICNRAQIVTFLYRYDQSLTDVPDETLPTEPPVTEPPVTEPPVTEPPVTEPPVTEPPVTDPEEPTEDPNMGEWA